LEPKTWLQTTMSKGKVSLLTLTVIITGLSVTSLLQSLRTAHSQQDYEEYLIVETNTAHELKQKNVGSGESTNINCGTNTAGTNLAQQITCPAIPTPRTAVVPVVTQRVVEVQATGQPIEAQSPCNPDEVVTGGGYDISDIADGFLTDLEGVVEEFAVNNAWHIKVNQPLAESTQRLQVYAECLKLVPA
jgi:hypothetical protein